MPIRGRSSTTVVLMAMCLGLMLSMFNSTMINVALPDLGSSLHASATSLQWVATIYTLTYAAALLLGGALGDRWGRRSASDLPLGASAFAGGLVKNSSVPEGMCAVLCGGSGGGEVCQARVGLGERFESGGLQGGAQFGQGAPDQAQMQWTDDRAVFLGELEEGAVP